MFTFRVNRNSDGLACIDVKVEKGAWLAEREGVVSIGVCDVCRTLYVSLSDYLSVFMPSKRDELYAWVDGTRK